MDASSYRENTQSRLHHIETWSKTILQPRLKGDVLDMAFRMDGRTVIDAFCAGCQHIFRDGSVDMHGMENILGMAVIINAHHRKNNLNITDAYPSVAEFQMRHDLLFESDYEKSENAQIGEVLGQLIIHNDISHAQYNVDLFGCDTDGKSYSKNASSSGYLAASALHPDITSQSPLMIHIHENQLSGTIGAMIYKKYWGNTKQMPWNNAVFKGLLLAYKESHLKTFMSEDTSIDIYDILERYTQHAKNGLLSSFSEDTLTGDFETAINKMTGNIGIFGEHIPATR